MSSCYWLLQGHTNSGKHWPIELNCDISELLVFSILIQDKPDAVSVPELREALSLSSVADQRKLFLLAAQSGSDGLSRTCSLQKIQDLLLTLVWSQEELAPMCQRGLAKGSSVPRKHSKNRAGDKNVYVMIMPLLGHGRSFFLFQNESCDDDGIIAASYNTMSHLFLLIINRIIFRITKCYSTQYALSLHVESYFQ